MISAPVIPVLHAMQGASRIIVPLFHGNPLLGIGQAGGQRYLKGNWEMKLNMVLAVACVAGLANISLPSFAKDGAETEVDYRIGAEVKNICFGRSINGWKTVDRLNNVLLLEKGVNHWYYVELVGGCRYNALRSALTIGIDSHPGGGCISRGDTIIVEDNGFSLRCAIQNIYEWDEDAQAPEEDDADENNAEDA